MTAVDIAQIKRLIDLMSRAPVAELEIEENGWKIRLARGAGDAGAVTPSVASVPASVLEQVVPAKAAPVASSGADVIITAPSYGVFHLAPAPDASPYVTVGQEIEAGQQVGLLEAMKVFNPVRATAPGRIAEVLVDAGTEVEEGTPLFRLA
ncbi:acetyl-CoA carboxylase biotin carboxyl carrier protein [Gluconobacter morbifer]|uniref:Biotin carboxyl carrier protein of acetyl-CoA carboxylase n=1 Tax=Gluconobacter morbifer G707 TaxID=1088869 RepID=G6XFF5_9PROT|nr:acetyl-CoA carboxylase biotin carboxyl carrier protein subunit [Gluconobacter morbifer]EHH68913.1 hypothetical protein GMO_02200 [Gluconobacter morbifer G707]